MRQNQDEKNYISGKQILIFVVFLVILCVAQVGIHPGFGDDAAFAEYLGQSTLMDFLQKRYAFWTSRVIIEAVLASVAAANPVLWRILNIAMILLLVWITADLFGLENKQQAQALFFAVMWIVPFNSLCNAGWIATTANYLWCLPLGLVAMRPVKHCLLGERCPAWEYVICPLAALYAANMEQMCAILLGIYLVFGAYLLIKKTRISILYGIQFLLVAASLCLIIACPGNKNRVIVETERFFPEFAGMNVIEKFLAGFLETAHYYIAGGRDQVCYLFFCFTGVLLLCIVMDDSADFPISARKIHSSKIFRTMTALCPLAAYLLSAHIFPFLLYDVRVPRGRNLLGVIADNTQIAGQSSFPKVMVGIQVLFYMAVLLLCVLAIFLLHGAGGEALLEVLILAAGFLSRVIIGLSPTIYVSGDRTALFCSMAILIVVLRNLCIWLQKGPKVWQKAVMGIYVGSMILCNFLQGDVLWS